MPSRSWQSILEGKWLSKSVRERWEPNAAGASREEWVTGRGQGRYQRDVADGRDLLGGCKTVERVLGSHATGL